MKLFVVIFALSLSLISCSESYKIVNHSNFNQEISNDQSIKNASDLINKYYGFPEEELTEGGTIDITEKQFGDGRIEVTLIHNGLLDDSQKAEKIVMTTQQHNDTWQVLEIKKNWKCRDGRGHTSWGTELCY